MTQKLGKKLGGFDVFCLASGAMVSSGIFVLPGLAHANAGPAVIVSYLLAGLLAGAGMLSVAEIITAMPRAGGDYFFIGRTLGPAVGASAGLLSWFSLTLKSAFALVGLSAFLTPLIGIDARVLGVVFSAVFVGVNLIGVHETARLQRWLVVCLLGLMAWYVIQGVGRVEVERLVPFAPTGWYGILSTAGLVFVSYGGLLKVASVAEEVDDPGRNIPKGLFASLLIIVVFYTLMVFVTSGVLNPDELDYSLTPISDGARRIAGTPGFILMSLAASFAFISTANAGMLAASRYLVALGRDRLMPAGLATVNQRFGSPHVAVLITGALVVIALFLPRPLLIEAASTVLLATYALANICVIVLRESRLENYRPSFRSPFYPWPHIVGALGFILLIVEMGSEGPLISLILILGGLAFYWVYGRIRAQREYALLYLLERVADKPSPGGGLETELKNIIRERERFCVDYFDRAAERAEVLEPPANNGSTGLVGALSEGVARQTGLRLEETRPLVERSLEQAAFLIPGLAVVDLAAPRSGQGLELILVRPAEPLDVGGQTALGLVLVVRDRENDAHFLPAAAALAQVALAADFWDRWRKAKNPDRLRDLFLTGHRVRACTIEPVEPADET
jgi:amino acid transporter